MLLRRKLDYAFPNQRAEVFVAERPDRDRDLEAGRHLVSGRLEHLRLLQPAGAELGATQHIVQTFPTAASATTNSSCRAT